MSFTPTLILLILILFLLASIGFYFFFYLPRDRKNEKQLVTQSLKNSEELVKLHLSSLSNQQKEASQQQEQLLKLRLEQLEKELRNNREDFSKQQKEINQGQEKLLKLHLDSLSNQQREASQKQEKLLQLRLDSLGQELRTSKEALSQINNLLLAPFERGRLGNIQLDRLLSLYLPKDDKIYQLEYTLKKRTEKGEGLRPDAVIFGIDQKNNLAIDSKFPLENYLASVQDNLSKSEKEERVKKFKENLKSHIKKVAEYISPVDDTQHVIMFIPSEVVFAKINEQSYYEIVEFALGKKVSLCSPVTLAIIINQILWANKTHEQYRTMDQVLAKLRTFWTDFGRWQDRWTKILEMVNKTNNALREFNISVEKIVRHGENIKKIEAVPQLASKSEAPFVLTDKTNKEES